MKFRNYFQGPFVAAFASSNLGDVSPNIKGPKCQKTGKPCDLHYSTCSDPGDACIASGPGKDMFESTAIIADRLFKKAWVCISKISEHLLVFISSLNSLSDKSHTLIIRILIPF